MDIFELKKLFTQKTDYQNKKITTKIAGCFISKIN